MSLSAQICSSPMAVMTVTTRSFPSANPSLIWTQSIHKTDIEFIIIWAVRHMFFAVIFWQYHSNPDLRSVQSTRANFDSWSTSIIKLLTLFNSFQILYTPSSIINVSPRGLRGQSREKAWVTSSSSDLFGNFENFVRGRSKAKQLLMQPQISEFTWRKDHVPYLGKQIVISGKPQIILRTTAIS